MSDNLASEPSNGMVSIKRPFLVWFAFVYCTILGALWAIGILFALHQASKSAHVPLSLYYLGLAAPIVRMAAGAEFFRLSSNAIWLSFLLVVVTVTIPLQSHLMPGRYYEGIFQPYRFVSVVNLVDWFLLICVARYSITLRNKGLLRPSKAPRPMKRGAGQAQQGVEGPTSPPSAGPRP